MQRGKGEAKGFYYCVESGEIERHTGKINKGRVIGRRGCRYSGTSGVHARRKMRNLHKQGAVEGEVKGE